MADAKSGCLKGKTPSQAELRLRGRLIQCCALDCALQWAEGYIHPGVNLLLPRGVIRSPQPAFTHATTRRVAGVPIIQRSCAVSTENVT